MLRYGSDKPDLRFGLEIQDATDVTRGSEFGVFASAATVRFLVGPRAFSRGELAKLEELREGVGREGTRVSGRRRVGGGPLSDREVPLARASWRRFAAAPGSTVLFVRRRAVPVVERVLGALRLHLGRELGLVDETRDELPLDPRLPALPARRRDRSLDVRRITPSRGPLEGHEELIESDPATALSLHYDLVWNGWELGSRLDQDPPAGRPAAGLPSHGHDARKRQTRSSDGSSDALAMGAPPHGGVRPRARPVRSRCSHGEPNIREVDRVSEGVERADPLTGAPSAIAGRTARRARDRVVARSSPTRAPGRGAGTRRLGTKRWPTCERHSRYRDSQGSRGSPGGGWGHFRSCSARRLGVRRSRRFRQTSPRDRAFAQRLVVLAAVASSQRCLRSPSSIDVRAAERSARLTSAPAPAGWNTAFAGSRGHAGDAQRTTCGQVLAAESLGVTHPVLPCGAKIVLRNGDTMSSPR